MRMICHFSYQDLPPKKEKCIPLGLVMAAAEAAGISCPFTECSSDLMQTTLFFCLWSCEYTKTNSHRRTVQFRLKDFQFHDADGVTPQNDPSNIFLPDRSVNLFLDMHDNSVQGNSITMESTNIAHGDPVSAAAQRFLHLRSHQADPDTTICSYFLTNGAFPKKVTSSQIASLLCLHAANIVFQRLGFYPHDIGSHSLLGGHHDTPPCPHPR